MPRTRNRKKRSPSNSINEEEDSDNDFVVEKATINKRNTRSSSSLTSVNTNESPSFVITRRRLRDTNRSSQRENKQISIFRQEGETLEQYQYENVTGKQKINSRQPNGNDLSHRESENEDNRQLHERGNHNEEDEEDEISAMHHQINMLLKEGLSKIFREDDFSHLQVQPSVNYRPFIVTEDGKILFEKFSPMSQHAQDFLIAISEPLSRPKCIHEYQLTQYSLYAATSIGLSGEDILKVITKLSKFEVPKNVIKFIQENTISYGKLKLILKKNRFFLEADDTNILQRLLQDSVIQQCKEDQEQSVPVMEDVGHELKQVIIAGRSTVEQHKEYKERLVKNLLDSPKETIRKSSNSDSDNDDLHPNETHNFGKDQNQNHEQLANNKEDEIFDIDLDLDPNFDEFDAWYAEAIKDKANLPLLGFDIDSLVNPNSSASENISTASTTTAANLTNNQLSDTQLTTTTSSELITQGGEDEEPISTNPLMQVFSFEINREKIEDTRKRCYELSLPLVEEYDFRNDTNSPSINIDLKSNTRLRPYQELSLNKMFGDGRARSGIIVLPCGAGKTLVGVTAACTIKKSCLVLCTSSVSVEQWHKEFKRWSLIQDGQVTKFTQDSKEKFVGDAGILISTYSMVTFQGKRAYDAQKMMDFIKSKEWGLLLLDEVHVVPAEIFKKVLTIAVAHSKLGLTATLVREDQKIDQLNYLIGPKLYEANWMDLAQEGHIANVQCAEVWCDMASEFYYEYLKSSSRKRNLLCIMNPKKIQTCQYLIEYHEARGDKTIVFSDNIFALKHYAMKLGKPYIYGGTSSSERLRVLQQFQHNPLLNTIFLSKIGDTSIDIPEANCLIQISSHYGSRRQEAQRLGRILRAKKRTEDGCNAFFYTVISRDTEEVYFSNRRQQFLIDQGYQFKIITSIEGMDMIPNLVYVSESHQMELLNTIHLHYESNEFSEDEEDDECGRDDEANHSSSSLLPNQDVFRVVRRSGTMTSLSGADNMAYLEYNRSTNVQFRKVRR